MVDFDVILRTAKLALLRLKSLDQFGPSLKKRELALVFDKDGWFSCQGNPAPMYLEGFLVWATVYHHLENDKDFIVDGDSSFELCNDRSSGGFILGC